MKRTFILLLVALLLGTAVADARKNKRRQRRKARVERVQRVLQRVPLLTTPSKPSQPAKPSQSVAVTSLLYVALPRGMSNEVLTSEAMTVYFNPKLHIPNCVIYELTETEVTISDSPGAEKRKNYNYDKDPWTRNSPEHWDYRGSGYDRGHMAPAMDMKWSPAAMRQCFYMTNMCPQDHDLNGGAWRLLEEKIHRWGKRDKRLIVATGPIMGKSVKTTGKSCAVAIPDAFYKVVYAPEQGRAIGFIYPNEPVSGSFKKRAVTIDEVERLTGLDFFPALPDNVENALESHANPDHWSN